LLKTRSNAQEGFTIGLVVKTTNNMQRATALAHTDLPAPTIDEREKIPANTE